MINALEAKKLYDESGHEVDEFLKRYVEPEVINAAKQGKRSAIIFLGSLERYHDLNRAIKPIHKGVMAKLQTLGYTTRIDLYGDYYVPRGLQNDDGGGPEHCNYGMIIGGW